MARRWSVTATLVIVAVSIIGCDVGCSIFGCDGMDGEPRPAPGPTPSPSPTPTPEDTTVTTTPGIKCSEAFKTGCGAQLETADDDACFILADDATSYTDCDKALTDHFAEYTKNKGDNSAINDAVLDGDTGTCLTALRTLAYDKKCPFPMPPLSKDIEAADSFNILALGDWGPTPQGVGVQNRGACECTLIPVSECRDSLFNWLEKAPALCTEARAQQSNNAQQLVADAMAAYATKAEPVAVLSLGDNFYIGGIPTPHNLEVHDGLGMTPEFAFEDSWNKMYLKNAKGDKLQVPWLSIMGNHDYGGAGCQADWQLQIDYSKKNENWRMPWQYFKQQIKAKSYLVDIFMLEVNKDDFLGADEHAICQQNLCHYTPGGQGGDPGRCKARVMAKSEHMLEWLEAELKFSVEAGVHWIVLAGHFPFGPEAEAVMVLGKKYGAAIYVAGHTHSQQYFKKGSPGGSQDMAKLVSGAGGGYRQEGDGDFYGFANMAFTKEKLTITLVDWDGKDRKGPDGSEKLEISHAEAVSSRRLNIESPSPSAKRGSNRSRSDRHTL